MSDLIAKLRYMGKQYSAGQYARGGGAQKHYLEEAADTIESQAKRIAELEKQRDVLEAVANRAQETERLLRERLMDVRMYLLNEADKHSPRDPVLGEAYQMTQRHLGWRPEPAAIDAAKEQQ